MRAFLKMSEKVLSFECIRRLKISFWAVYSFHRGLRCHQKSSENVYRNSNESILRNFLIRLRRGVKSRNPPISRDFIKSVVI